MVVTSFAWTSHEKTGAKTEQICVALHARLLVIMLAKLYNNEFDTYRTLSS